MFERLFFFPTVVSKAHAPEFLDSVRKVSKRYLDKIDHPVNELYPVQHTWTFHTEPEIAGFSNFVLKGAWEILAGQGYLMNGLSTLFQAMWLQDHHKSSSMEMHTHPVPATLVGFYFTEVPAKDAPYLCFDDPRPAKMQTDFAIDMSKLQVASNKVWFIPKEGDLYLAPAWLPHALSRNGSKDNCRCVHLNVMLGASQQMSCPKNAPEIL